MLVNANQADGGDDLPGGDGISMVCKEAPNMTEPVIKRRRSLGRTHTVQGW